MIGFFSFLLLQLKYKLSAEEVTSLMFFGKISCIMTLWMVIPFMKRVLKLTENISAAIGVVIAAIGILTKKVVFENMKNILQDMFCLYLVVHLSGSELGVLLEIGFHLV